MGSFEAMRSPCQVWMETTDEALARQLGTAVAEEVWRIQDKYSRFLESSVIGRINRTAGEWFTMDEETAALLAFADECWRMTDGRIDVTVGAYMKHWRFDGKSPPPAVEVLKSLQQVVGWDKVDLDGRRLRLPPGGYLDLGGIGKEYAVDRCMVLLAERLPGAGAMVNLGGDLHAMPRKNGRPWQVGVEGVKHGEPVREVLSLLRGGIATSGDTRRYAVDEKGRILGHILDPRTGWPVENGPATVTVVSGTATQAGILSTLAMLHGEEAERFLQRENVRHLVQWRTAA